MGARFDAGSAIGGVLYKDVKQAILAALSEGEWKPGEVIPSERKLIERFSVSIGTLRKAIDELVAENILIRHQGRGTFVATHRQEDHFFRFFRVVRQDGHREYPTVKLARFRRAKADKDEAAALGLAVGEAVFRFTNVLSLEGNAVMIDAITVPEARFKTLTEKQLRERRIRSTTSTRTRSASISSAPRNACVPRWPTRMTRHCWACRWAVHC